MIGSSSLHRSLVDVAPAAGGGVGVGGGPDCLSPPAPVDASQPCYAYYDYRVHLHTFIQASLFSMVTNYFQIVRPAKIHSTTTSRTGQRM